MPDATACIFCNISNGYAHADIVHRWDDALAFRPLGPRNDGHVLVIPRVHFARPDEAPDQFGALAALAAVLAGESRSDYNLIVNAGPDAGQTVFHLHLHVLPRARGDGIYMPWDECGCTARSFGEGADTSGLSCGLQ